MYGCENRRHSEKFLKEQVFPLMLHKNTAEKFSFEDCKYYEFRENRHCIIIRQTVKNRNINLMCYSGLSILIFVGRFIIQRQKETTGRVVFWNNN